MSGCSSSSSASSIHPIFKNNCSNKKRHERRTHQRLKKKQELMEGQLRHSQQMEIDNLRSKFIEYLETEHKVKVTDQGNSPLKNTLIVHTQTKGSWNAIDTN